MKELLDKIHTAYSNDSDLSTALSGGLFKMKAKREPSMPYGIVEYVDRISSWTAGNVELPQSRIQFRIFSSADNVEWDDIRTKLTALFDNTRLTGSSQAYTLTRTADHINPDPDDIDVLDLIVEYLVDEVPQ